MKSKKKWQEIWKLPFTAIYGPYIYSANKVMVATCFDEELDAYNLDGLYVSYNDYYESFDVGSVKVGMYGDTFSSFTSIKWVHELQHILRICQINKKVTL